VLFPDITSVQIVCILVGGAAVGAATGLVVLARAGRVKASELTVPVEWLDRQTWRMPAIERLSRPVLSSQRKIGLVILRGYLLIAFSLVVVKIVEVALK
jgi:hypothetical protein